MSFEIEPIQGQPGLFRYQQRELAMGEITPPPFGAPCCGQALPDREPMPPLSMRLGSIEDQLYAAAEWSKASLQVTPETPLSPVFQNNLRGFAGASEQARLAGARSRYFTIKAELQPVLDRFGDPILPQTYQQLVSQVVRYKDASLVRLAAEDAALLLKAGLLVAAQCLQLAEAIEAGPNAAQYATRVGALVSAADNVLGGLATVLGALRRFEEATDSAARVVGLAEPATVAALIAGGVVLVAAGGLLYLLLSQISSAVAVYFQASAACEADERAGRPCTGESWSRYADQEGERQRRLGVVPDTSALFREAGAAAGSAIRGAAWIVALGLVGYAVWTTLPAARTTRERLAERAAR